MKLYLSKVKSDSNIKSNVVIVVLMGLSLFAILICVSERVSE